MLRKGSTAYGIILYSDDGLHASTRPEWLQGVFIFLMEIFEYVVLQANIGNKVDMVFKSFCKVGNQLEEDYALHKTGEGLS